MALDEVVHHAVEGCLCLFVDKPVAVDTLALVNHRLDQRLGFVDFVPEKLENELRDHARCELIVPVIIGGEFALDICVEVNEEACDSFGGRCHHATSKLRIGQDALEEVVVDREQLVRLRVVHVAKPHISSESC